VDRGGDVTYHGPGQLVGYPLLPLEPIRSNGAQENSGSNDDPVKTVKSDYVGYVRKLEETLIAAIARLGVATGQRSGKSGVWVQADAYSRCPRCKPEDRQKPAKLAAIGVKVDARGITRHGFALNVNPDMNYFDGIIACGLNEPVVSLEDLLTPVPAMARAKDEIRKAFVEAFIYERVPNRV
jgi:lipoate-protein ligase B